MIVEMIELFLQETPQHLANLKQADEDGQWNKVASEAHKIKPIMLYVGLSDLNLVCKKIEDNAKGDHNSELSKELINQLEGGYKDISGDLEKKIDELR